MDTPATHSFGPFRLDPQRRRLERDGVAVPLSPRAFDILQVLVEERGRVLSRAEIMARVWPDLAVEEHNLSVQMSKLRRALGDTGEEAAVIATLPGRGYRFVAAVDAPAPQPGTAAPAVVPAPTAPLGPSPTLPPTGDVAPGPAPPGDAVPEAAPPDPPPPTAAPPVSAPAASPVPPRRTTVQPSRPRHVRRLAATLAATALAGLAAWLALRPARPPAPALSIVVMPFRDLSDGAGEAYLADAIGDDLTTDLAHIPGSTVIARETADSYKGRAVPAAEIGRALGVRYLVEGSLRAEGGMLHVNAQLIDARDARHLWAQRFDVDRDALGTARDAIVGRIATALGVELVAADSARSREDRPNDPGALDLFLRARSILDRDDSLDGFCAAQSLLERAVALEPASATPLAELGATLLRKVRSADDPTEQADVAEARAMIARALQASPRNPRALAAQAHALLIEGRLPEAIHAAQAALATDPANLDALAVTARGAAAQGRLDDAAQAFSTLLRLNPGSVANRPRLLQLANVRLLQGDTEAAVDLLGRATAGDPEPAPGVDSWGRAEGASLLMIAARAMRGETATARALFARYEALWPHRSTWRIGALATRAMATLPGFARMQAGLREAGMPAYADEHADHHVAATTRPLPSDSFAPTPLVVPGAASVDTAGLAALLAASPAPLVLDLGEGAAVPPGALWEDRSVQAGDDAFVDAAVRDAAPDRQIVVLSDGPYGSAGYDAALRLVSLGRRNVSWYRGGEESWAASGLAATDRRP